LAILKSAKNGTKKTHLLNSASLSYEQLIRYVEFLKSYGLVEEHNAWLKTTDKGLKLVSEYESSSLIRVLVCQHENKRTPTLLSSPANKERP
jgi:predicted transcriptional regulator